MYSVQSIIWCRRFTKFVNQCGTCPVKMHSTRDRFLADPTKRDRHVAQILFNIYIQMCLSIIFNYTRKPESNVDEAMKFFVHGAFLMKGLILGFDFLAYYRLDNIITGMNLMLDLVSRFQMEVLNKGKKIARPVHDECSRKLGWMFLAQCIVFGGIIIGQFFYWDKGFKVMQGATIYYTGGYGKFLPPIFIHIMVLQGVIFNTISSICMMSVMLVTNGATIACVIYGKILFSHIIISVPENIQKESNAATIIGSMKIYRALQHLKNILQQGADTILSIEIFGVILSQIISGYYLVSRDTPFGARLGAGTTLLFLSIFSWVVTKGLGDLRNASCDIVQSWSNSYKSSSNDMKPFIG